MQHPCSASSGAFDRGTVPRFLLLAGLASTLAGPLASCSKSGSDTPIPEVGLIRSLGTKPAYGPTINDQLLAVIEQFVALGDPPLPTLTARQARIMHSVTDAVDALLTKNNRALPAPAVATSQRVLPPAFTLGLAPDGVLVRIYTPTAAATWARPGIVYYHGGGWVIGSLMVYEPSVQALAEHTGAVVVSVDYRLASKTMNKFPAAHEDAYAAYKWVRENAAAIGINPAKIAVAGENAGGNMAGPACLLAKERSLALPVHELLVYPVANNDLTTSSYVKYAITKPLDKAGVEYFVSKYFNTPADGDNRLISLVDVADLKGLPPTTIIAEIDPL